MFALANEIRERAGQTEFDLDRARERVTELMESTGKATGSLKLIPIITPQEARAFTPDPASFLVGEGLIAREQFITIGGEPGCGKSRLATTLAVAGARGHGQWQGYPVRSQWRTLILQSENKGTRLARWSYDAAAQLPGRKVLMVDEVWKYCSPHAIPQALAEWILDGRKLGMETLFASQQPNRINEAITNEVTELVCFRLQGENALGKITGLGLDAAEVADLPPGSFVALNCETGGERRGRVF